MTFDNKVSRGEQLQRIGTRRKRGRKHEHRIGPGRVQPKGPDYKTAMRIARFKAAVSAYWRGELEEFPEKTS